MNTPPNRTLRWIIAGVITFVVVAVFSILIWLIIETRPARSSGSTIPYEFKAGTGVRQLASDLEDKGVIKSALAFELYVTLRHERAKLEAGSYELDPTDTVSAIVDTLSQGRIATNKLVVPEGSEVSKIRTLAGAKGISADNFNAALKATYGNDFLAGRPSGDTSLEGYLFPDSYQITKPVNAQNVIQQMLNNFTTQINKTDVMQGYAAEGMTLHQGLTLASIVEKEAGTAEDRPIIAQVFLKRLKQGMPLQSDVTTSYAAELLNTSFNIKLDSKYNTYAYGGLPPGPICNPGIDSMKAVAHPATTDYLYFIADKQGMVHYAKTAEEHEANVQKYLR